MKCPKCGASLSAKEMARELGRAGGRKRGKTRFANMTPEQLSDYQRAIARKRWAKKG